MKSVFDLLGKARPASAFAPSGAPSKRRRLDAPAAAGAADTCATFETHARALGLRPRPAGPARPSWSLDPPVGGPPSGDLALPQPLRLVACAPAAWSVALRCDGCAGPAWTRGSTGAARLAPSLLKSLMQKNVRRGRPHAAVRCACALARGPGGVAELARRLVVVVVEDAALHPLTPVVAWAAMAAAAAPRDWEPSEALVGALLRVVHDVAACPARDSAGLALLPADASVAEPELRALPPLEASYVRALLARAALGGMKCDTAMLRGAARLWADRFAGRAPPPPAAPAGGLAGAYAELAGRAASPWLRYVCALHGAVSPPARAAFVSQALHPGDLILSGVDFHCSDVVAEVLADPGARERAVRAGARAGDVEGEARSAMWACRSGRNEKREATTGELAWRPLERLVPIYSALSDDFDAFSFAMLRRHWYSPM
eukprot:m51a1_g7850 hypothetical protein (432) ;mRNA; r:226353-228209